MARVLKVAEHLPHDEVVRRFLACRVGDEKLRWQAVMLKMEGRRTADIADVCKRRPDWVRRTVRKYNQEGPDALKERRGGPFSFVLDEAGREALREALMNEAPPGGGLWTGKKVARWIGDYTGIEVTAQTGLNYLKVLGFSLQRPRPRHPEADQQAQETFKKKGFKAPFEW